MRGFAKCASIKKSPMKNRDVFIASAARTPIGNFGGTLKNMGAVEMGIHAVRAALERAFGSAPAERKPGEAAPENWPFPWKVDEVILGNAREAGVGPNPARQIAWRAGLGDDTPAFTINMACASGLQTVVLGAQRIGLGEAEIVVAGGAESMSRVRYMFDARWGVKMGHQPLVDGMYRDGFLCPISEMIMGETAELLADQYKIGREEQDEYAVESQRRAARAANALRGLVALIEALAAHSEGLELHEQAQHVVQLSGLIEHYRKEKGEKGQARIDNLEELVNAARQFEFDAEIHGEMRPIDAFLAHAALEAGEGQADEWEDAVQLMTLHSAKGLEFPLVFLCGMEEGLFPHQLSLEEPGRLEEERRLAYVGMTRAMRRLFLTYAEVRRLYGEERYTRPSRFIREVPAEYIEEVRLRGSVKQPAFHGAAEPAAGGMRLGQRVLHTKFGEGVVLSCEGQGAQARVQVNFDHVGSKWLVLAYANLQVI